MALIGTQNYTRRHPIYSCWVNMRQRCTNTKHPDFKFYGGREVKICKRWDKFENFLKDMGNPPKGYTLDRINNNKGYTPSNCKWSTRKEQSNNRNYNAKITYRGKTQSVGKWAFEIPLNISTKALYNRIFTESWDIERAFTQPLRGK
jgi:hypothetical protein